MPEDRITLLTEIKLLLQEELSDVREAMHEIKLEFASLRGDTIARAEFQKALDVERDKRELTEAESRQKRETLEKDIAELKTAQASMATSMKIYIGLAGAVAGIIGSGIGALLFAALA
jgi:uncharacterized protein YlxW (UPF0749 family)